MNAASLYELNDRFVLHSNRRPKTVIFDKAEGSRLWDIEGKEYLDLLSSNMGPAMVGHSHPAVVEAISRQAAELISTNILYDNAPLVRLCAKIAEIAPPGITKTYICPGGGEANEAAIKLAIELTGRTGVVSLTGAYHGQSLGTMSLCGMPALRDRIPEPLRSPTYGQILSADPYRPWTSDLEGDWKASLQALEARGDEVAAVIIEPIQAVAGHVVFTPEYYADVQRVCRERGILLIADEIQTALGRCGALWGCELVALRPDIITTGKAFGAGLPYGAIHVRGDLVTDELERSPWHMVSAQGNPLQAAVALAVIGIVEGEGLVERSRALGDRARRCFEEMAERYDVIGDIRGPGLFIGVDLVEDRATRMPATAACEEAWAFALDRGLITQFAGPGANVFKLKPPLTVPEEDFERMLAGAEEVIAFVQQRVSERQRVSV